jgi:hypothetical protein
MNLHNEVMNITCEPDRLAGVNYGLAFKQGHKSAIHAASEIALKANAEINRLKIALSSAIECAEDLALYAPEYFIEKHKYAEEIEVLKSILNK